MAPRQPFTTVSEDIVASKEGKPSTFSHGSRQVPTASVAAKSTMNKPYKISSHTMMSIMRRDAHDSDRYYHPRARSERALGPPHMRSNRVGRGLEIHPGKLCEFCDNLNLEDLLAGAQSDKHFDEGRYYATQGHHFLPSQLENSAVRCPLCRLFFRGLDSNWTTLMQLTKPEPVAPHRGQCRFKIWAWNGDYERRTPADTGLRYLVMEWAGYGTDAYAEVLLTARRGSEGADFGGIAEDVDAPLIDGLTSSKTWDIITGLWETCALTHKSCQFGQTGHWQTPSRQQVPLPTRVIVADSRCPRLLESRGQKGVYAALSHCWGETYSVKTTRLNYEDHKKRIHLSPVFPTFLDAIKVCEILGIPYLWIDTLCIIQHDPTDSQSSDQDFLNEAKSMGSIYSRATLTIAATGASDVPTQGLFGGERERLRQLIELPFRFAFDDDPAGVMYASPVPKDYTQEVSDSRLFTRGWVLQERLMSTRYLHFGREQWFWQCRESTVAESDGLRDVTKTTTGADLGLVQGLLGGAEKFHYWWCRVVQIYTELDFLYARDKIIALQGLMNELSRMSLHQHEWGLAKQHAWGIWKESLHVELMWYPVKDDADQLVSVHGSVASHLQAKPARSPQPRTFSWSWLSSTHPVKFPTRADKSTSRESGRSIAYPGGTIPRRAETLNILFRTHQQLNASRTSQSPSASDAVKSAIWSEMLLVNGVVKAVTVAPIAPQQPSSSSRKRATGQTAALRLGPLAALFGARSGGAVFDHHMFDPAAASGAGADDAGRTHIGFCRLDEPERLANSTTNAAPSTQSNTTINTSPSLPETTATAATTTVPAPAVSNPTPTPTPPPPPPTPDPRIFLLHLSNNTITSAGMDWRGTHKECAGDTPGMVISHNVLLLRKRQGKVYERIGVGVVLREFVGWFDVPETSGDGNDQRQQGPVHQQTAASTSFVFV